jgi:hypothetical protein
MRLECHEFQTSLGYIGDPVSGKKKKKRIGTAPLVELASGEVKDIHFHIACRPRIGGFQAVLEHLWPAQ